MTTASTRATPSSRTDSCHSGRCLRLRGGASPACDDRGTSSPVMDVEPRSCEVTRRSLARDRSTSGLAALLDLGGLAAEVAQVVELGAAHVATGHDLDLLEDRRVEREGALD